MPSRPSFELEEALESAQKAAALAPTSALAQARVAELLMSLGRIREAEKAARQAVAVDPKQSRGYVILGFVQLAEIDTKSARQSFNQAIELDSTDPLPRLGLGLAIIRDGKLEEGRQQIEIAVALDPTNSLLRSYVGKAYYEENTHAARPARGFAVLARQGAGSEGSDAVVLRRDPQADAEPAGRGARGVANGRINNIAEGTHSTSDRSSGDLMKVICPPQ